jgi:cobalt-zinc-cadmium efflux system outer membrane protein
LRLRQDSDRLKLGIRLRKFRTFRSGFWFGLACVLGPSGSAAQAPPATEAASIGALHLSIEQAAQMARERAPEVRVAQSRVAEAEATKVGAGIVMPANPRLAVDFRPSLLQSAYPTRNYGYSATVDFLFEVGGAPGAREREAERRARSAEADAELSRFNAGMLARRIYVAALSARQRIEDIRDASRIAARMQEAARERITAGAAGDIDVETARLEVAQNEAALQGAMREYEAHLMALREVLDVRGEQPLMLTTRLQTPPAAPPAESLVDHAMRKRPELAFIRSRMGLLEATEERLEREVFPRVGVFTGLDAAPYSAMFLIVGASVELPVAQRNQGPRAVAGREMVTERARLELGQRRIAREVMAARLAYESRRAELATLTEQAVPAAERNLGLIETGWRSGRFDVFRVTAAARDLLRSKGLRLDALEAAWLDRIDLEQASGGWPP